MFRELEYAVVDVETTGFSPAKHDRVIEIAVCRVDSEKTVLAEYATLVNPERDVGPTHVHGITAGDVREAPTFSEVVGDVLTCVRGAVLVAHNAAFDMRFLLHECAACGAPLPPSATLCTMRLSRRVWPDARCRKLPALCARGGIDLTDAHSALQDARATAALLCVMFQDLRRVPRRFSLDELGVSGHLAVREAWPCILPSGKQYRRPQALTGRKQQGRLQRLFEKLPAHNDTNMEADAYLDVLERALEDRRVSEEEIAALQEIAASLDMDREEVRAAHRRFLSDVIQTALLDGVITPAEQQDIEDVANLLEVSKAERAGLVAQIKTRPHGLVPQPSESSSPLAGKSVCFTGQSSATLHGTRVTRQVIEDLAANCGMRIAKRVTKKLDYLVCADPDSMSGKARKAREYGVRIIAEPAFLAMLTASGASPNRRGEE